MDSCTPCMHWMKLKNFNVGEWKENVGLGEWTIRCGIRFWIIVDACIGWSLTFGLHSLLIANIWISLYVCGTYPNVVLGWVKSGWEKGSWNLVLGFTFLWWKNLSFMVFFLACIDSCQLQRVPRVWFWLGWNQTNEGGMAHSFFNHVYETIIAIHVG